MKQPSLAKWWQRPQPAWATVMISMMTMLLFLGVYHLSQPVLAEMSTQITRSTTTSSGSTLPYQGFISDSGGDPLNGNQNFQFALYDTLTGGTALWSENQTAVPVSNGVFNVLLGSQNGIPATVWENTLVYLQLTVNGEVLNPRTLVNNENPFPKIERIAAPQRLTLTNSYQTLVSTTIDVSSPSQALVIATCDCESQNGNLVVGQLYVNGVTEGFHQMINGAYPVNNHSDGNRYSTTTTYVVDLPAGSNTIEFKLIAAGSSINSTAYEGHSGLAYIVVTP